MLEANTMRCLSSKEIIVRFMTIIAKFTTIPSHKLLTIDTYISRRMDFLLPTLLYITIGLWLTTAFVEQLADVFRLVHYAGRQVKNVKGVRLFLTFISVNLKIDMEEQIDMKEHLIADHSLAGRSTTLYGRAHSDCLPQSWHVR